MRKISSFILTFITISCCAQNKLDKHEVEICKELLDAICKKENITNKDFAIENMTGKQISLNFHCALKKIDTENYLAKIVRNTNTQDIGNQTKLFNVNEINCFKHDYDSLGSAFFIVDSQNWNFLIKKRGNEKLYFLLSPYTPDKNETENGIKLD